jgi:hypothetical protein
MLHRRAVQVQTRPRRYYNHRHQENLCLKGLDASLLAGSTFPKLRGRETEFSEAIKSAKWGVFPSGKGDSSTW